jgi:hypothetical protein
LLNLSGRLLYTLNDAGGDAGETGRGSRSLRRWWRRLYRLPRYRLLDLACERAYRVKDATRGRDDGLGLALLAAALL